MQSPFQFPHGAQRGAVTIGNFDGVHIGHQRIIAQLRDLARHVGGPAVVFTFRPSPVALLRPDQVPLPLTTFAQREQLLHNIGVDEVVFYPTTLAMLQWTDREFFDRIVRKELQALGMVEGTNFRFGRQRKGDVETLKQFCREADMQFQVLAPVALATQDGAPGEHIASPRHEDSPSSDSTSTKSASGDIVSSSRIRELLLTGAVMQAAQMLGRPHSLTGTVVRGDRRGMLLGFPTANLSHYEILAPGAGVYAGQAKYRDKVYSAAIHIGPAPTFGGSEPKLEVHLLDFQGDLYGEELNVSFCQKIREVARFDSAEHLRVQLQRDVEFARQVLPGLHFGRLVK